MRLDHFLLTMKSAKNARRRQAPERRASALYAVSTHSGYLPSTGHFEASRHAGVREALPPYLPPSSLGLPIIYWRKKVNSKKGNLPTETKVPTLRSIQLDLYPQLYIIWCVAEIAVTLTPKVGEGTAVCDLRIQ